MARVRDDHALSVHVRLPLVVNILPHRAGLEGPAGAARRVPVEAVGGQPQAHLQAELATPLRGRAGVNAARGGRRSGAWSGYVRARTRLHACDDQDDAGADFGATLGLQRGV